MGKIKSREELKDSLKELGGKKIVTTNGSFDIIHIGHVKSLVEAKKLGDVLIVGLNSDSSIKKYKSPDRPIIGQEDRAEMLAALECVDYVTIFDETDPIELLKIIKPDFHVKSKSGFKGLERDVVEENGGKIILLDDVEGKSTTGILERLKKS